MPKATRTTVVEFTPEEIKKMLLEKAAEIAKCSAGTPSRLELVYSGEEIPVEGKGKEPNLNCSLLDPHERWSVHVELASASVTFTG